MVLSNPQGFRNLGGFFSWGEDRVFIGMAQQLVSYFRHPVDIVGMGEMGNTTSASAIICATTGISPHQSAGRGTGLDNKGWESTYV